MKAIKQKYQIKAPVGEVWRALVDPKIIDEWGGGKAKMSDQEGSEFSLWDGSIWGKNIKVVPEKKLVQEWFSDSENKKWAEPSIATFTLIKKGEDETEIDLLHEDVPDEDRDSIEQGWNDYYLGAIKKYFENK